MDQAPSNESGSPATRRMDWTPLRILGLLVVIVVVAGLGYTLTRVLIDEEETDQRQSQLQPFYTPPQELPATEGAVIRAESMPEVTLANGSAQRVLYASRGADGGPLAVSGMVFTPKNPAPNAPVVAWAHPTLGQADQCAPSRSGNPLVDTTGWLDQMLGRGWVVAATDYAGLGTPGPKTYLLGAQSARDVVNSVRAARSLTGDAGVATAADWALWSHSQGGQAALWAAAQGPELAPELTLRGVAAAAPSAQLAEIMDAQWDTKVAWVIGPEATESFEVAYPNLAVTGALSATARTAMAELESKCIFGQGLGALTLGTLEQKFFASNPTDNPAWSQIVQEQTPPIPAVGIPILLVQGTDDEVVLAPTNALLQNSWCAQGVNLSALWLGGVNHQKAAVAGGPAAVEWLAARLAAQPQQPNCAFPPPVPAAIPVA